MDHYVPISKKHPQRIFSSGPRQPPTDHCPVKASIKSLLNNPSKRQDLTLSQAKLPLQNPYTSFTLRRARSG